MHRVGERTIERDGAYARAIDAIAEVAGLQSRQALLARETKLTQQEVQQLADVAKVSPPTVQEVMASMQVAKTPKAAKQIVHLAVEAAQKQVATGDNGTLAKAGVSRATLTRLAPMPKAAQAEQAETPAPPLTPADDLGDLLEQARSSLGHLYSYLTRPTAGWLPLAPEQVEALARHAAACRQLGDSWCGVQEALTASEAFRTALQPTLPPAEAPLEDAPVTLEDAETLGMKCWLIVQQLEPCINAQVAKALNKPPKNTHRALQSLLKHGNVRKDDLQYRVVEGAAPSAPRPASTKRADTAKKKMSAGLKGKRA
jgi:hypothetical protein